MVITGTWFVQAAAKMMTNGQLWYTYQHYLINTKLYAAKYLIIPAASGFSKNSNPCFPGYNNSTIQYKTIRFYCPINRRSLCSPADRTFYKMSTLTQMQGGVPQAVSLIGISAVAQQHLHLSSKHQKKTFSGCKNMYRTYSICVAVDTRQPSTWGKCSKWSCCR